MACEFEASVSYGHGKFSALNTDVQFIEITEFSVEFDLFIMQRSLTPRLAGTYDSFISFTAIGTQVAVSFCIGDAFCGRGLGTEEPRLSGRFAIDSECLNKLNSYFRSLANMKL